MLFIEFSSAFQLKVFFTDSNGYKRKLDNFSSLQIKIDMQAPARLSTTDVSLNASSEGVYLEVLTLNNRNIKTRL